MSYRLIAHVFTVQLCGFIIIIRGKINSSMTGKECDFFIKVKKFAQ